MVIITIIITTLVGLVGALSYAVYNSSKKLEIYEDAIQQYYEKTAITLHTMRAIDERQLFEKDDDVGTTFQMLVDTLGQLRPLIYGVTDAEKEE